MPPPVSPGDGHIHARLLPPSRHVLPSLEFVYPLKLIASSPPAAPYLTVFLLSYGGGLVSNDRINLTVLVEAHAKLCLLTQADQSKGSTKIFKRKHPTHHTTQSLTLTLHPSSALLLLPDPVQPFADSHYSQRQTVLLPAAEAEAAAGAGASFVLLDWVSEGRTARGERWQLARFESRTEIYSAAGGRLLLRDAVVLDGGVVGGEEEGDGLCARMDGLGCVATLIVGGPRFAALGAWVVRRYGDEPRGGRRWQVLWTATAVRGFVVVKVGGGRVEEVRGFLGGLLEEEGSVVREFGAEALRCLQ
ncbi:UreD urease accessory protein-domain-containing protein [Morchella snyderi]|nr:UreD urease accessory protein-domain-containing protein [Morchella snyderi]